MAIQGENKVSRLPQATWFSSTYQTARDLVTAPDFVGVVGAVLAIALLLFPPLQWSVRLSYYSIFLIWTLVRPRVALYLLPLAVAWGSLDAITIAGLNLNSADLLVGFLLLAWMLSYGLPRVYRSGAHDRARGNLPAYFVLSIVLLIGVMVLSLSVATNI